MAALARAGLTICPVQYLVVVQGWKDAAARRRNSPIDRPAAFAIRAICFFSAGVTRTGMRSVAVVIPAPFE
jgi:hypothetical protein